LACCDPELKHRTLSPVVERFIECAREFAGSMGAKNGYEEVGAMSLHGTKRRFRMSAFTAGLGG
jgi:hypothetical protein